MDAQDAEYCALYLKWRNAAANGFKEHARHFMTLLDLKQHSLVEQHRKEDMELQCHAMVYNSALREMTEDFEMSDFDLLSDVD